MERQRAYWKGLLNHIISTLTHLFDHMIHNAGKASGCFYRPSAASLRTESRQGQKKKFSKQLRLARLGLMQRRISRKYGWFFFQTLI